MSQPRVELLAETGPGIGVGHVRRLLALAGALRDAGATCGFRITDMECASLPQAAGFPVCLWCPDDAAAVDGCNAVVLDGYHYDTGLTARWRGRLVRAAVDDLANRPQEVDLLVNPNIFGASCDYRAYRAGLILAGPDYCLVAPGFRTLRAVRQDWPARILVSFGGTDDGRYCLPVVRALRAVLPRTAIDVAMLWAPADACRSLAALDVAVHVGRPLEELMETATLYVGAAGTTLVEAAAAGRAAVVCAIVDNQALNVAAAQDLGMAAFPDFNPGRMAAAAATLVEQGPGGPTVRIDGRGAERVAQALLAAIH